MQSELKPCAHCGSAAELSGFQAPEFWVACPKTGCKANTEGFGSKDRAIAAWNARTSDAEITRLTEALRDAEEREKALREALGQLSSYVGTGIGDEGATSEQFIKRITWGIDHISNAQLTFAAEIVEECSKIPQTTWGEVKQAILARQAPAGAKP